MSRVGNLTAQLSERDKITKKKALSILLVIVNHISCYVILDKYPT